MCRLLVVSFTFKAHKVSGIVELRFMRYTGTAIIRKRKSVLEHHSDHTVNYFKGVIRR